MCRICIFWYACSNADACERARPLHYGVMTYSLLAKSALPVLWPLTESGVSNVGYLKMNACV